MKMLYDPDTAFNRTDEVYLGTWFGFDAWAYVTCSNRVGTLEPEWSILLVEGNEGGNYQCWVGNKSWFDADAVMGTSDGSISMSEHLTESDKGKAYLMAFAALHHIRHSIEHKRLNYVN